ncbi:GFA family protein [Thalassolituus sp. LLYu03]|uniref:GFA family protein n=1 Tax=Thalassolituus sp. LLYu03 TaxID=3421656 RepID=UPI003D2D0926
MRVVLTGGCLCGAVRYRVDAELVDAGYCHCRQCQRSSGAPVLAWATIVQPGFVYTSGAPVVFHSSVAAQREHCAACGTQLVFRPRQAASAGGRATLDFTLASLDEPAALAPQYHIWTMSQIPWLAMGDSLSRHEDEGPDIPA